MSGGRPKTDRIDTTFRVLAYLAENPDASAATVARVLRIRKQIAQSIVRRARGGERRFPNSGSGT
jgi:hypothetical protein